MTAAQDDRTLAQGLAWMRKGAAVTKPHKGRYWLWEGTTVVGACAVGAMCVGLGDADTPRSTKDVDAVEWAYHKTFGTHMVNDNDEKGRAWVMRRIARHLRSRDVEVPT